MPEDNREIVYREVGENVEVMREGDAEATYVCHPVYLTYRRDEPAQTFERTGMPEFSRFEDAVAECVLEANEIAFGNGSDARFDGGLTFTEGNDGAWTAREWDTVGCDWRIELDRYEVADVVNGGDPVWLESPAGLGRFIEDEVEKGWF